jgi:phage tail-like protein
MADATVRTTPVDPFLTYNFLVSWDGNPVAAVTKVTGLTKKTETVTFRSGGQSQTPFKIPGTTDYQPITLERGVTFDVAFEQWANKMWYYPNTQALEQEVSLGDFRKNIQIALYNQAGQIVIRYNVYNCWPSEYTALPDLDSAANTVALARLTLEHEGWDRDTSVTPPTLPTFTQPSS